MTLNVPALRVQCDLQYLSDFTETGLIEGYWVAVQAIAGKPLTFIVHLENGALYCKIPIQAMYCEKFGWDAKTFDIERAFKQDELLPWSCLNGPAQVVVLEHLSEMKTRTRMGQGTVDGRYILTIDYHGANDLADDPTQYKSHNIVCFKNGQLAAYPNNYLLFEDKFYTDIDGFPKNLKRQSKWYFAP